MPSTRRGPGRRGLLAGLVTLLLVAGIVTTVALWPSAGSTPTPPVAAASPTKTLAAGDRLVQGLQVGQCLAMTDRLDDVADPDAATVACGAATATFTVTSVNQKLKAREPCEADEFLRSLVVHRVVCLDRYLQRGQCVLGNGVQQFLVSAVPCDAAPTAPFTQVFRIQTLNQSGVPVTCTPPLRLVTATPNRSMCLAQVG